MEIKVKYGEQYLRLKYGCWSDRDLLQTKNEIVAELKRRKGE